MGTRADGRLPNELRPVRCERGVLNRADGSSRWAQDETCVLVGVFGPRHGGTGKQEDPQRATLEVWWTPKTGQPGVREKYAEALIRRTLDAVVLSSLLPRTRIKITIQEVHDNGSLLACAINATCTALLHAGIPMSSIISAVQCCVNEAGEVVLDPTKQEEQASQASCLTVFPTKPQRVEVGRTPEASGATEPVSTNDPTDGFIACEMLGSVDVNTLMGCTAASRAACLRIDGIMRASVEQAYPVQLQT